jgi:mRNA interferase RelE/StbE
VASYRVLSKRSASRELEALQLRDRRRVVARIGELANDTRPVGSERPSGQEKYRIRQGEIHMLYEIADQDSVVTVVKIDHRKDVDR